MSILDTLVEASRARVEQEKREQPKLEPLVSRELEAFAFEEALRKPEMSFICEVKKASPSKGLIAPAFPYLEIARDYEAAGAAAISVLTEPDYFFGEGSIFDGYSAGSQFAAAAKGFYCRSLSD